MVVPLLRFTGQPRTPNLATQSGRRCRFNPSATRLWMTVSQAVRQTVLSNSTAVFSGTYVFTQKEHYSAKARPVPSGDATAVASSFTAWPFSSWPTVSEPRDVRSQFAAQDSNGRAWLGRLCDRVLPRQGLSFPLSPFSHMRIALCNPKNRLVVF